MKKEKDEFGLKDLIDKSYSEKEKQQIVILLQNLLLKKQVCTTSGKSRVRRAGAFNYLKAILPFISSDFDLLERDKESFYQRFIFTPTTNETSLYFLMLKKGYIKNGRFTGGFSQLGSVENVFISFTDDYEISPYERCDIDMLNAILDEMKQSIWLK